MPTKTMKCLLVQMTGCFFRKRVAFDISACELMLLTSGARLFRE